MTTSTEPSTAMRRWKPYPSYKASGLGTGVQIPSHWSVMRLKHIAAARPSNVDKKTVEGQEPVRLCNYVDVYKNDAITPDMDFMRASATPAQIAAYTLKAGDVIITKDSETWMDIAVPAHVICDLPGVLCGYHLALVRPRKEVVDGAFLFRSFSAAGVLDQFRVAANGITRFGLGTGAIADALFPLPPLDEQRRIVEFLDRETAKIDALIAKKERLIELLREKRTALISHAVTRGLDPTVATKGSDTAWIASIPNHWQVKRLKYASVVQTGLTLGKDYSERATDNRPYLRVANVQDGYLDLDKITEVAVPVEDVKRHELRTGDVLMTEGGDFDKLGRGYVWDGQIAGCLHQNHIFAVRPVRAILKPHFLASLLTSAHGKNYFTSTAQQTTNLASTNSTKLKNFPLPLPSVEEQQDILDFLGRATERIDLLISKVREAIDKLREYYTALISAAVTGKIDVSSEVAVVAEPTPGPVTSAAKPANAFFRRTVFAAEIIDRLCDEPTFGHVKFQKCLFVAQHHLRVGDFEESYKRMAAGPYDNRLVRSVDSQLEKGRWFKAERTGDRYAYRRLDKAGGHRQYFERYFGEHAEPLARLLDLFRPMTTDQAEIVATLYAVWNDFLLRGEPCDDDRIVAEVLTNWHDRKKRFEDDRWRRALGWMRENGLVPNGFGTPTVPGDGGTA